LGAKVASMPWRCATLRMIQRASAMKSPISSIGRVSSSISCCSARRPASSGRLERTASM
jgi:hypothetical protein